jgi:hypothetical protein
MGNVSSVNTETRVNENVVRLVAALVLLTAIGTFVTGWAVLALYLSVDFFLRAFTGFKPPFALAAQQLSKALHLEVKPIYAAPKKFAAAIGFVFSVVISALLLSGFVETARVVTGVLVVFATLESVFGICAGCYVYSWVVAPLIEKFK